MRKEINFKMVQSKLPIWKTVEDAYIVFFNSFTKNFGSFSVYYILLFSVGFTLVGKEDNYLYEVGGLLIEQYLFSVLFFLFSQITLLKDNFSTKWGNVFFRKEVFKVFLVLLLFGIPFIFIDIESSFALAALYFILSTRFSLIFPCFICGDATNIIDTFVASWKATTKTTLRFIGIFIIASVVVKLPFVLIASIAQTLNSTDWIIVFKKLSFIFSSIIGQCVIISVYSFKRKEMLGHLLTLTSPQKNKELSSNKGKTQ